MSSARRALYTLTALLLMVAFAMDGSASASSNSKKKSDQAQQQQTSSAKVDLNTASEKDLDAIPGVGPATVKKIVSNRPYSSIDDLKKAGLSESQIEKIRPMATVSSSGSNSRPELLGSNTKTESPQSTGKAAAALPQSDNSTAAPASGSGMVWVNLDSKIYHREGDRWYGKTKHGKYMSESDAQAAGYRAAKNGK